MGPHHFQFFDKDHTADVFCFVDQNDGEDKDNEAGESDSDDEREECQGIGVRASVRTTRTTKTGWT
ncbi:hypothetical protein BDN67DRAFT_975085 [Paxillus ammoniavirescens]|nr:hypothetical protein BDN67DRAFT_975085 [Paxillus ammoniavirescens]